MQEVAQIVLDMDGTFVNLYEVKDWESRLRNCDPTPYLEATPLVNIDTLVSLLDEYRLLGGRVVICSWSAMDAPKEYNKEVRKAKKEWCEKYNIPVDEFHVVKYGTKKHRPLKEKTDAILFDDNADVREQFTDEKSNRVAYDAIEILKVIQNIIDNLKDSNAQLAVEMIERACEKKTMAYCYQAQEPDDWAGINEDGELVDCTVVTKVGMTTCGKDRIINYCREKGYWEREDILYFPVDNASDAHAMEDMLHCYFHLKRKQEEGLFRKNDRFYGVTADAQEMLKEDGMLMRYYHALGY